MFFLMARGFLRSPEVQRDPRRYLQVVQKVIACMTLGIDVSKLFSEMIMVCFDSLIVLVLLMSCCYHRNAIIMMLSSY